MTTVYFVRHAQSNNYIHDDRTRPLTEKGWRDRALVTEFLRDKNIDAVLSSPYKRAVDTVAEFAEQNGLTIETFEGFRERRCDSDWIDDADFLPFIERQWGDFSYKLSDGECLGEVQERNIAALSEVLARYRDKRIVIGTHGAALSSIINYFDRSCGYKDFIKWLFITPWAIKMEFEGNECLGMEKIDIVYQTHKPDHSKCIIETYEPGALKLYHYVRIFARYQDKWLYCRIKNQDAFGCVCGHIEHGETPLEAAKRELFEETGAMSFEIIPAFDYSIHAENERTHGQAFLAHVRELAGAEGNGALPDYEIAEIKLFDALPDKMRFPEILPDLYRRMQVWMNLNSGKGELWDVYDHDRNLTGETHRRGDPLPETFKLRYRKTVDFSACNCIIQIKATTEKVRITRTAQ